MADSGHNACLCTRAHLEEKRGQSVTICAWFGARGTKTCACAHRHHGRQGKVYELSRRNLTRADVREDISRVRAFEMRSHASKIPRRHLAYVSFRDAVLRLHTFEKASRVCELSRCNLACTNKREAIPHASAHTRARARTHCVRSARRHAHENPRMHGIADA